MYTLETRGRVQGFISGVWGLSGLVGPLVGGLIADATTWRWVFYLNLPFGLVAALLVWRFLQDRPGTGETRIDWLGAAMFTVGSSLLLWGLELRVWPLVAVSVLILLATFRVELRHPAPLLPIASLRARLARVGVLNNLLAGAAYFGSVAFIPLFAQGVSGRGATEAGVLLTPMLVGWTVTSIVAARVMTRVSLVALARGGFSLLVVAFGAFALLVNAPLPWLGAAGFFVGCGMGFAMFSLLLSVQEATPREELGAVTSAVLFSRTMGGALGVALMSLLIGPGITEGGAALAAGLQRAFLLGFVLVFVAWVLALRLRPGDAAPARP